MSDVYDGYWETDEFEDLVARSLIGLHETNVKKEKRAPKNARFNDDIYKRFKAAGCYFPPDDRVVAVQFDSNQKTLSTQKIDIANDGLPKTASVTFVPPEGSGVDVYLIGVYVEKLLALPKPFGSDIKKGAYYRFMQLFFENNSVSGYGTMIAVGKDGSVQSCYVNDFFIDPITKRQTHYKNRPYTPNKGENCEDYHSAWGSMCIQFSQDRRYLWNVQAQEEKAKAVFGVYPEQIKSLFYARDLPQTDTGRKRPILHWVSAHQRRMKSGTEVDIEQYLRGTHEFVMNGTQFKITNPLKNRV